MNHPLLRLEESASMRVIPPKSRIPGGDSGYRPVCTRLAVAGSTGSTVVFLLAATLGATSRASAQVVTVPATANIFGAGHASPPAPGGGSPGTLPPVVTIPAGAGVTLSVTAVSGTVELTPPFPNTGDGSTLGGV